MFIAGHYRPFALLSKFVIQALVGQAFSFMASLYCFTGEWGCPTRLILTFKDDALRSPPAVCAIKVPKPATLFDRFTFLLQLQKMFGTFNVLKESCTRMLQICMSTLD